MMKLTTHQHQTQQFVPGMTSLCSAEGDDPNAGAGGASSETPEIKPTAGSDTADERKFTQADLDRLTALARRQGREIGAKTAKAEVETIVARVRDELVAQFKAQQIPGAAPQAPAPAPVAKPAAAATGTETEVENKTTDPALLEIQAKLQQQEEQLKAERNARIKLEKDREAEKERARVAEQAARKEQVINEVVSELVQRGGLSNVIARGCAKNLIIDGKIEFDENSIRFVTSERDEEDGGAIKLPLRDGIERWSKSADADEYRPSVRPGSGESRGHAPFANSRPVDPSSRTESERWAIAEAETVAIYNARQKRAAQ